MNETKEGAAYVAVPGRKLTKETMKRVFVFDGNNLDDPNPDFSPKEVLRFYSGTYPELTNATIPDFGENKDGVLVFDIDKKMGTNG